MLQALLLSSLLYTSFSANADPKLLSSDILKSLGRLSGISVLDLDSNSEVFSYKSDQLLVPASTLKLVTSIAALQDLGASYTFKTKAFLIANKDSRPGIGIEGGADPEFTTEQVYLFARKLKLSGIKNIRNIVLDSSALKDPISTQGERAYEAGSSALSFNFNSIGFQICPSLNPNRSLSIIEPLLWEDSISVSNNLRTIAGANSQIKLTFIEPTVVNVSGFIGTDSKCVEKYLSNPDPIRSLGYFFKKLLEDMSLGTNIEVSVGIIPNAAEKIFEFDSKQLSNLLVGLNHYSTNVSAEQILAAIGTLPGSKYLSRANGIRRLRELLSSLGSANSVIEDGSGLSPNNRISAHSLSSLLSFAWKKSDIRPYLESSLSILGQTGTLKFRTPIKGNYRVLAKSGTLDGVSSLAGYLYLKSGRTYAFSIIQNEIAELESAHRAEERLLQIFAENY